MGVIKEMENKVIQQQTQKLQELGPSPNASKTNISQIQDNSTLGPMEETTLDFENLVLGKKTSTPAVNNVAKPPTSPPPSTFQTQSLPPQPFQPTPSARPTTSMALMQPIQPTTSIPTVSTSTAFYPPLQPSSPAAFPAPPRNNGVFPSSQAPAFSAALSPFGENPWGTTTPAFTTGNSSTFTSGGNSGMVPTIAPPPAKPAISNFQLAKPAQGNGLDKYQSLL
jgi:hypothetical protein